MISGKLSIRSSPRTARRRTPEAWVLIEPLLRHCYIRISVDAGSIKDGRGDGLIARGHQDENIFPRMGPCIRWNELIPTGKDSGGI